MNAANEALRRPRVGPPRILLAFAWILEGVGAAATLLGIATLLGLALLPEAGGWLTAMLGLSPSRLALFAGAVAVTLLGLGLVAAGWGATLSLRAQGLVHGVEAAWTQAESAKEAVRLADLARHAASGAEAGAQEERRKAEKAVERAHEEHEKASRAREEARRHRDRAEAAQAQAERERVRAEEARAGAEEARVRAEEARDHAERARAEAEAARDAAEENRMIREQARRRAETHRERAQEVEQWVLERLRRLEGKIERERRAR